MMTTGAGPIPAWRGGGLVRCTSVLTAAVLVITACERPREESPSPRLSQAAYAGDAETVDSLVAAGHPVDRRDDSAATPLMVAAQAGHHEVVARLVSCGGNVNALDEKGRSPLVYALAGRGQREETIATLRTLLSRGADPNRHGEACTPPLAASAYLRDGELEAARLLVDHGARLDGRDPRGMTALMHAAKLNKPALVELLLRMGADVEARDYAGANVVTHAARKPAILRLLFEAGATPR